MRRIYAWFPLFASLLTCGQLMTAQSRVDFGMGFGSAYDSGSGVGIDNANSINAFGACTPGSADPNCEKSPTLSGFFLGFGGTVMLSNHFGAGAQVSFQPNRPDYGPLQYRQTFYDFDGVYSPLNEKKFSVLLEGGIGGARTTCPSTRLPVWESPFVPPALFPWATPTISKFMPGPLFRFTSPSMFLFSRSLICITCPTLPINSAAMSCQQQWSG
jgi:hypothetical protein